MYKITFDLLYNFGQNSISSWRCILVCRFSEKVSKNLLVYSLFNFWKLLKQIFFNGHWNSEVYKLLLLSLLPIKILKFLIFLGNVFRNLIGDEICFLNVPFPPINIKGTFIGTFKLNYMYAEVKNMSYSTLLYYIFFGCLAKIL